MCFFAQNIQNILTIWYTIFKKFKAQKSRKLFLYCGLLFWSAKPKLKEQWLYCKNNRVQIAIAKFLLDLNVNQVIEDNFYLMYKPKSYYLHTFKSQWLFANGKNSMKHIFTFSYNFIFISKNSNNQENI